MNEQKQFHSDAKRLNPIVRLLRYGIASAEVYWVSEEIDLFFQVYSFSFWKDIRDRALTAARRGEDVKYCLVAKKMSPKEVALYCIRRSTVLLLRSGRFHVYRNALNDQGKSYRLIFGQALAESMALGLDEEEAEAERSEVDNWIAALG